MTYIEAKKKLTLFIIEKQNSFFRDDVDGEKMPAGRRKRGKEENQRVHN